MRGLTLTNVCHCGFFTYLVFMSLSAGDSISLTDGRGKVPKFKVTPKGNLWATGHFMGKKSVMDTPLLRSPEDQGGNEVDVSLPAEQTSLFQEFLRVALKAQMDTEESRLKDQSNFNMPETEARFCNFETNRTISCMCYYHRNF
uniref:Neuromedin Bb n=1 Tax=Poecilia mexicana TaxID=48701 RepID=A0A3B3X475_9TELE